MNKIVCSLLLFAGIAAFTALTAQDTARGGTGATWRVEKYDLDVSLPADSFRTVSVKAALSIKNVSGQPAGTLTLRISPLAEIAAVRSNGSPIDFSKSQETVGTVGALQRAAIRVPTVAPGSMLNVTVDYKIKLADNSGVASITPSAATFLPLAFWYPTPNSWFFPKGGDSAPLKIKVTAPAGQTIVSSGLETGGAFEQKLNVQPFFLTGNWESRSENGVSIYMPMGTGVEGLKRGAELGALFTEARTYMVSMLGPSPDVPLRIVSARRGPGFITGGTVIVDEAVFRRSRLDSQTAMNIAEAAAKLWIGNAVSVNGEGFGVVSEGLVRYLATQFIESRFGHDVSDVERLRQRNAYASVSKRDAPMSIASSLDDFYYPVVANKGAMAWRLIAGRVGPNDFGRILRSQMQDGNLTLAELRGQLSSQKELVDYLFDQVTDMNLQIGLPQVSAGETKSALRNTGSIDANVDIAATTSTGEKLKASTVIPATKYGEVSFKTSAKIVRIEVDSENLYPQTEYFDDVQPRETTDNDPLLAAKREFDKQDFAGAESRARTLLRDNPHLDDLRIILARALLAQNKNGEAEREFKAVLDEKLPTSRSLAWANLGLAEIASRSNQNELAIKYIDAVLAADAEYGASLAARNLRNKLGAGPPAEAEVKAFFSNFDKAASSNRKADVDALVVPGEVTRFAGGVSGSTESWQTNVRHVDRIDANTVLVEADMAIKLLNKEQETGIAVYRLVRSGGSWKLAAVEMFEVR
jgi:hypothetical protein